MREFAVCAAAMVMDAERDLAHPKITLKPGRETNAVVTRLRRLGYASSAGVPKRRVGDALKFSPALILASSSV